ncbi:hypothetical protein SJC03_72 [Bacteroides phage SJC03]|nr:hypothetical protein SJC03_72 [Bacteroides phage SJC03]
MQGELKILAKNKINLSSFTKISELNKSYQEGIYSDTPQNQVLHCIKLYLNIIIN